MFMTTICLPASLQMASSECVYRKPHTRLAYVYTISRFLLLLLKRICYTLIHKDKAKHMATFAHFHSAREVDLQTRQSF